VLTNKLELTTVTEMTIVTGDCTTICQHPYRPPEAILRVTTEDNAAILEQNQY